MSTGLLLTNLVLVGGVASLGVGCYFQTKELYLKELFQSIEKCQKFHLDYVDSTEHLPINKPLLLFGTARALTPTPDSVITRTYIKQAQQEDRLWHFKFSDRFGMATAGNQLVEV